MNKVLLAASFLPLAATAVAGDAESAARQAFATYAIDFRGAVLLAQNELGKTDGSGKSAAIDKAKAGDEASGKTGGASKASDASAGKGAGDRYTTGGYKEQPKTSGAGKQGGGDGYTTGGYKEQPKTSGAGKQSGGDGYTYGGYKEQPKSSGAGKQSGGDGYTTGGYKEQTKVPGAGKQSSEQDGYTGGNSKFKAGGAASTSGASDHKLGDAAGSEKSAGGMKDSRDGGSAKMDDGMKSVAGVKDFKEAGAGRAGDTDGIKGEGSAREIKLSDAFKTSGGMKDIKLEGAGKADGDGFKGGATAAGGKLGGITEYMKSGRSAPLEDGKTSGLIKITTTEGSYKFAPAGGHKLENAAVGGIKGGAEGATAGGIKLDAVPLKAGIEPVGGKAALMPVAPSVPLESVKPVLAPAVLAPAPVTPAVVAPTPVASPAVVAPQPMILQAPTLVPSVMPTK